MKYKFLNYFHPALRRPKIRSTHYLLAERNGKIVEKKTTKKESK